MLTLHNQIAKDTNTQQVYLISCLIDLMNSGADVARWSNLLILYQSPHITSPC